MVYEYGIVVGDLVAVKPDVMPHIAEIHGVCLLVLNITNRSRAWATQNTVFIQCSLPIGVSTGSRTRFTMEFYAEELEKMN